jgi:DNA-binding response OmpR family regulator
MRFAMRANVTAKQILVVDDDPNIREVLIQRLRQRDFQVEGAPNGDVALTMLATSSFDVVLLDLMMPVSGGRDVLRAIGALMPPPRVIVVSALANLWKRSSTEAVNVEVLEKPFDFARLLTMLER